MTDASKARARKALRKELDNTYINVYTLFRTPIGNKLLSCDRILAKDLPDTFAKLQVALSPQIFVEIHHDD